MGSKFFPRFQHISRLGGRREVKYTTTVASPPTAGWTSFQQGANSYTGTTDTYVQSGANEAVDRSTALTIFSDKNPSDERFGLTRFDDLSAAFTDHTVVTVTSASIDLYITSEGQGMAIYTMLMDWADTDTWTSRNASGLFTGGTGYMLSSLGGYGAEYDGVVNQFITVDLDAQTVQDWIRDPGANKGMFMIGTDVGDGQQHASADNGTAANRPILHLAYTEPA